MMDTHRSVQVHAFTAGHIETAVRRSVEPGLPLKTPTGRGSFSVARYTDDGLVLLLGRTEAWTPLPGVRSRKYPTCRDGSVKRATI